MVLGLIVIITILSPINRLLFKNKPNYTDILKRYELDIEQTTIQTGSGTFLEVQKDMILENYKGKLIPQMVEMIERNNPVTVREMIVHCNEDTTSNEFGKIIAIDMIIEKMIVEKNKKTINIPKIKIGTKTIEKEGTVGNEGQIEKKIKTICFTDHVDFEATEHKVNLSFRPHDYFKDINRVKYKYRNHIEILAGVEIGAQPSLEDRYQSFVDKYDFDFGNDGLFLSKPP